MNSTIGMNAPVGDQAAIEFSIGFYDGIGDGCSYKKAYHLGKMRFTMKFIRISDLLIHLSSRKKLKNNKP